MIFFFLLFFLHWLIGPYEVKTYQYDIIQLFFTPEGDAWCQGERDQKRINSGRAA